MCKKETTKPNYLWHLWICFGVMTNMYVKRIEEKGPHYLSYTKKEKNATNNVKISLPSEAGL